RPLCAPPRCPFRTPFPRLFLDASMPIVDPRRLARAPQRGTAAAMGLVILLLPGVALAQTASFSARRDAPTGLNPRSLAAAHLNGDGRLDVAVADSSSNDVTVLLGTGDGG